ncbi:hypothetical protein DRP53_04895 [candidate division WOR-3 bacterium]|uniref:Carboxypeptidase regulatory-like domain-containing protein n=1 Tax=candidate division WOR-3 bacterium TaxID=2052148 RepID=A0A660SI78_UNCW3|nr:MAG: hypothetical protein DRP53_04895 [candidate division WOR-3 bacterium]
MNAPRDNPFDPNLGGNICGRVLSRGLSGIPGVEVLCPEANAFTYTDSAGNFSLFGLPEDSLWIFFDHDSFVSDSVRVSLRKGRIDSITIHLNGKPYLINCKITTHHYERNWPPDPLYFCQLSAIARDLDGEFDIDSVWFTIPEISLTRRLSYSPSEQNFNYTLFADELPGENLEVLVGKDVFFMISDKENAVSSSGPYHVGRIIYRSPCVIFPAGGQDTIKSETSFVWHRFDQGFYVRYHGEIVRIIGGGPGEIAHTFDLSGQNDTTYRLGSSLLDPGEYYWTLEVIDNLGNSCRSKEEKFYKD